MSIHPRDAKLHGNVQSFPTEQHRLSYAISRLEGVVFDQMLPYIVGTAVNLADVDALIGILNDAFGDQDEVTRELRNFKQGANREFSLYFANFQNLSAEETNWNEATKRDALQNGLCEELKDSLILIIEEDDFLPFVKRLQVLDNNIRARQADKKKGAANPGKGGPAPAHCSARNPTVNPPALSPGVRPTNTGSGDFGPAPMDLPSRRHSQISREERARRKNCKLCYACRDPNHYEKPVSLPLRTDRSIAAAAEAQSPNCCDIVVCQEKYMLLALRCLTSSPSTALCVPIPPSHNLKEMKIKDIGRG